MSKYLRRVHQPLKIAEISPIVRLTSVYKCRKMSVLFLGGKKKRKQLANGLSAVVCPVL